jgi:hypothetical protein
VADSSWNTYTPDAPRRRAWGAVLTGLGVLAALALFFGTFMAMTDRQSQASAWPTVKQVVDRLQSDDRSRELYRANPALANTYPNEDAFLACVREFRPGLHLPDAAPPKGPDYRVRSDIFDFSVRIKSPSGIWLEVVVEGGPFGVGRQGEGLVMVNLGKEIKDLRRTVREAAERRSAQAWLRFRALAQTLARDGSFQELARTSPQLSLQPGDAGAFAGLAAKRRTALLALPEQAKGLPSVRTRVRQGPFTRTVEIEAALADGGRLKARWKGNQLVKVELL